MKRGRLIEVPDDQFEEWDSLIPERYRGINGGWAFFSLVEGETTELGHYVLATIVADLGDAGEHVTGWGPYPKDAVKNAVENLEEFLGGTRP